MSEDTEYVSDILTGRRVEIVLSNDTLLALQYFPEFDNICLSFYSRNLPGFTIGMPTDEWARIQELFKGFTWRGRKQ
jgi:hypothetical protein